MTISDLHIKAMELADAADYAKLHNEQPEKYIAIYREAFQYEKDAAINAYNAQIGEPSISILFRSAASLALECELYREAEQQIALGLAGNPPEEIAEELRDLLENVNFNRHLKLKGVELQNNEVQLVIAGKGVGFGYAKDDDVLKRISNFNTLATRTIERKKGKDFRTKGKASKDITSLIQSYVSVPRAASFAITLRLGSPIRQLSFDGFDDPINAIISDITDNISLINDGNIEELKKNIPNEKYLSNFINLSKELAPDGKDISLVGLTYIKNGKEIPVKLTRSKQDFKGIIPFEIVERYSLIEDGNSIKSLSGILSAADATSNSVRIDTDSGKIPVTVPDGLSDIVKNYWDEPVEISVQWSVKNKKYTLISIDKN